MPKFEVTIQKTEIVYSNVKVTVEAADRKAARESALESVSNASPWKEIETDRRDTEIMECQEVP